MDHGAIAEKYFDSGYSCSQAVMAAFCDVTGMDESLAVRLASPFGGGIGRMREVCGAVSGMYMVLGILYGCEVSDGDEAKKQLYKEVQELAAKFKEEAGSIICRDILKNPPSDPTPSKRTPEYYKKRPCARMVILASWLMDEFIENHPLDKK